MKHLFLLSLMAALALLSACCPPPPPDTSLSATEAKMIAGCSSQLSEDQLYEYLSAEQPDERKKLFNVWCSKFYEAKLQQAAAPTELDAETKLKKLSARAKVVKAR